MGQVFVEKEDIGRRERYFCLFPNDLVALSVTPELVGYCFEVIKSVKVNFPRPEITTNNIYGEE